MDPIVSRISEVLVARAGYRQVGTPLRVAEIDFRFDAVLVGPNEGTGLVVVVDLQANTSTTTARRIRGLVTVLDRLESRRTVSVILVLRTDVQFAVEELEKYCHTILVRPESLLESSLRPLLPLVLPQPDDSLSSAQAVLLRELDDTAEQSFVAGLLRASEVGPNAIDEVLRSAINNAIVGIEELSLD